ncbi:hypothetical protein ABB27_10960 [Stenotrophomonas terrae]|uniref:DUF3011 domain-containing protein n=1 Tax=Stenotrophomonas terrae TaxID=405446 RepID=A0A0R0CLM1_9GAMM|nr:DUF3011 domain-containing protein [Stenotrophomonas terrae]KRG67122.1 hypothetical protein ABB27_10960 [Stenotrophomonas terrae]
MKRVCGLLLLLAPTLLSAQESANKVADRQVVRCESEDQQRAFCPMDTSGGVQLVRQLSKRDCIRETSWGTEEGAVWVSQGCRAEFARPRPVTRTTRRVVRCESRGRMEVCPVVLRGAPVRLLRQQSVLPCREGRSWGYNNREIWVSRGCQGQFEVGAEDGSGFVDIPRKVVCESKGELRRECGVSVTRRVTLVEQLSSAACREGDSWGWDRNGIWVDKGCRGEFSAD